MTNKEAIEAINKECENTFLLLQCSSEFAQALAQSIKALEEVDKLRAEVIEEFIKKLTSDEFQKYDIDCVFETSKFGTYSECIDMFIEYVNAIAEQLKEQK